MSRRFAPILCIALASLTLALAGHGCGSSSGDGDGGSSGGGGTTGTTSPGTGTGGGGAAAALAVATPATGLTGDIPLDITISHPQPGTRVDIEVEYSIDAGLHFAPATAAPGGSGSMGLQATPAGATYRWLWASVADLGRTDQTFVRLRARPVRPAGAAADSATFEVKNAALGSPFTRYPYVQKVAAGSAVIMWRTPVAEVGSVQFGPTPLFGASASEAAPTTDHQVEIAGLAPASTCFYRVFSGSGAPLGPVESFRVPGDAATQTRMRFAVFGDSGTANATQYKIAALMRAADPDFYLHMGDVIYPIGAASDYDPKFFVPYRENFRRAPVYPAIGNHDILSGFGSPYTDAFECFRNPNGSEKYYTFEYGNARFIAVDTSLGFMLPGDPQHRWLVNELARQGPWTWTFVFHHHPPYSGGSHGSQYQIRYLVAPHYEQYGVDAVFTGHDHNYERTRPIKDFNAAGRGVVYYVSGGAGAGLRGVSAERYTEVIASEHHYLLVEIDGRTFTSTAYREDGSVLDTWTFTK